MKPEICAVVPARNSGATLEACLRGAIQCLEAAERPFELIVVDDGSSDATADIARREGAKVIRGGGRGPGAARNLAWRATRAELVWFVDSDCEPEAGCLSSLLCLIESDEGAAGAGGSYSNLEPNSRLATVIHIEITWRHSCMPTEVDHLGSYHLLLRRSALLVVNGFDETVVNGPGRPGAEDMDLSFRLRDAGFRLLFTPGSRVGHHHPVHLARYLRSQALHGAAAARMFFLRHRRRLAGTTYSRWRDHVEPGLAIVAVGAWAAAVPAHGVLPVAAASTATLLVLQLWAATQMAVWASSILPLLLLPALGFVRAFVRAAGAVWGLATVLAARRVMAGNGP